MQSKVTEIVSKVKNYGIAIYQNWLTNEDLEISKKIVNDINCLKGDYRGIFEPGIKYKLVEVFLKLRFKNLKYTNYFFNLSKKLGLKNNASENFITESKFVRADCWVSPISDKPVLDWHFDYAYSGAKNVTKYISPKKQTIKFFFYLSDVTSDNGCLSYIPNSHFISIALRKGIYEKSIKYTPYWKLNDFRNTILIDENYNYLKKNVDPKILSNFLVETEPSSIKNGTSTKYDCQPIKAGGAVIFNDAGAHRGSKTLLNKRLALRFFFRKK